MRLLVIGLLEGHISEAGKIALQRGAKVMHCESTSQALGALRNGKGADIIMIDVKQKIGAFIKSLETEHFHIPVVACGVNPDARAAVKAIQEGAKEYIPLPPDAELIAAVLAAVSEDNSDMIASDPAMKRIVQLADKIAPSEATILVTGQSGTGKEVISRYIHAKSKRSKGVFISINCAAIPENLLESELFGHEKGAFTGAIARKLGKFEEANGGTLLLDEITEMPLSMQAKLLRAIQEREIDRVGGKHPVKIDIRLIATSNRDMLEAVQDKIFREDLYYRLNVVNLELPPLKERPSDILKLAQFFADKYALANGVDKKTLSKEAETKITTYHWPGNIRELENTMHRAILISLENDIEADAIHLTQESTPSEQPLENTQEALHTTSSIVGQTVADMEKQLILNTLDHCIGNRTQAANILGISIRTLRNKLNQYKDNTIHSEKGS